jgi:hypothetical protein
MRQDQAFAAAGAVLALVLSAPLQSRAMMPALIDPKALAGEWTLTGPGQRACRLVLKAEPAPGGQGLALELGDCAGWEGPIAQAASWRTSNDGFGLATADRSTVLFFSNQGGGRFRAKARDGREYVLTRSSRMD